MICQKRRREEQPDPIWAEAHFSPSRARSAEAQQQPISPPPSVADSPAPPHLLPQQNLNRTRFLSGGVRDKHDAIFTISCGTRPLVPSYLSHDSTALLALKILTSPPPGCSRSSRIRRHRRRQNLQTPVSAELLESSRVSLPTPS